jgi:hypothetical protein
VEHLAEAMPEVTPHVSRRPAVRMHSIANPLGKVAGVDWRRPWVERTVATKEFLSWEGEGHPYLMLASRALPEALSADIGSIGQLSVGWRKVRLRVSTDGRSAAAASEASRAVGGGSQPLVRREGPDDAAALRRDAQRLPPAARAEALHALPALGPRRPAALKRPWRFP